MRQKCVKMGLVLLGKEERPKCVRNPSKLRHKCVKNARNTFGGEHLLDDTELTCVPSESEKIHAQKTVWGIILSAKTLTLTRGNFGGMFSETYTLTLTRGNFWGIVF